MTVKGKIGRNRPPRRQVTKSSSPLKPQISAAIHSRKLGERNSGSTTKVRSAVIVKGNQDRAQRRATKLSHSSLSPPNRVVSAAGKSPTVNDATNRIKNKDALANSIPVIVEGNRKCAQSSLSRITRPSLSSTSSTPSSPDAAVTDCPSIKKAVNMSCTSKGKKQQTKGQVTRSSSPSLDGRITRSLSFGDSATTTNTFKRNISNTNVQQKKASKRKLGCGEWKSPSSQKLNLQRKILLSAEAAATTANDFTNSISRKKTRVSFKGSAVSDREQQSSESPIARTSPIPSSIPRCAALLDNKITRPPSDTCTMRSSSSISQRVQLSGTPVTKSSSSSSSSSPSSPVRPTSTTTAAAISTDTTKSRSQTSNHGNRKSLTSSNAQSFSAALGISNREQSCDKASDCQVTQSLSPPLPTPPPSPTLTLIPTQTHAQTPMPTKLSPPPTRKVAGRTAHEWVQATVPVMVAATQQSTQMLKSQSSSLSHQAAVAALTGTVASKTKKTDLIQTDKLNKHDCEISSLTSSNMPASSEVSLIKKGKEKHPLPDSQTTVSPSILGGATTIDVISNITNKKIELLSTMSVLAIETEQDDNSIGNQASRPSLLPSPFPTPPTATPEKVANRITHEMVQGIVPVMVIENHQSDKPSEVQMTISPSLSLREEIVETTATAAIRTDLMQTYTQSKTDNKKSCLTSSKVPALSNTSLTQKGKGKYARLESQTTMSPSLAGGVATTDLMRNENKKTKLLSSRSDMAGGGGVGMSQTTPNDNSGLAQCTHTLEHDNLTMTKLIRSNSRELRSATRLAKVSKKKKKKKMLWTKEENSVLLSALQKHGKEWKKVAAEVKTRTVRQIQSHAQHLQNKNIAFNEEAQALPKVIREKGTSITLTSKAIEEARHETCRSKIGNENTIGTEKAQALSTVSTTFDREQHAQSLGSRPNLSSTTQVVAAEIAVERMSSSATKKTNNSTIEEAQVLPVISATEEDVQLLAEQSESQGIKSSSPSVAAAIESANSEGCSTSNVAVTPNTSLLADNSNGTAAAHTPRTRPKFNVKQKVLAKDTASFLLYRSIVRKQMYGPKSRDVKFSNEFNNNGPVEGDPSEEDDPNDDLENPSCFCWHYYLHYQGWNVRWDRWVDERFVYDDSPSGHIFMKLVKEESNLHKRVVNGIAYQRRMVMLEAEFREREGNIAELEKWLQSIATHRDGKTPKKLVADNNPRCKTIDSSSTFALNLQQKKKRNRNTPEFSKAFVQREVKLRTQHLRSRQPQFCAALNLPFTIKKILTDEWEVISQCSLLHNLPTSVTIMDVLGDYLQGKIRVLRADSPAVNNSFVVAANNGDDTSVIASVDNCHVNSSAATSSSNVSISTSPLHKSTNEPQILEPTTSQEQEWKDMTDGLATYFDQALPVQLLYEHEMPQHKFLRSSFPEKRYCEIYPCEHLLRLLLCLPELLAGCVSDSSDETSQSSNTGGPTKEERSKILFKIGDLVRFLQKYQNLYLLQCFRKPNAEEIPKATRKMRQQPVNLDTSDDVHNAEENGNSFTSSNLNGGSDILVQAGSHKISGRNCSELDLLSVGTNTVTPGSGRRKRKMQTSSKKKRSPVNPTYCNL